MIGWTLVRDALLLLAVTPFAYYVLAIIAAGMEFRSRMSGHSDPDASDRVGDTVAPLIAQGLAQLQS